MRHRILLGIVIGLSCQASIAECPTPPADAVEWRVEDGGNGNHYKLFPPIASWDDANAAAIAMGGHLVTITSVAEQSLIGTLGAPVSTAIGLRQVAGSAEPSGGWEWVTGEPFEWTNWSPGEPNHDGNEEDCGFTWFGNSWNDGRCFGATNGFIVEWERCDPCPPPAEGAVQWQVSDGGNGNWYKRISWPFAKNGPQWWPIARAEAEAVGGHLATITSHAENEFVRPLVTDGQFNVYLIGGHKVDGQWRWVTGEAWDYSNWYPGEPNNATGNEIFLATWVTPGTWNDVWPEYQGGGYVVEWEACNDCPGDISVDRIVNGIDLAYVLADWGGTLARSDVNDDGVVDGIDLGVVLNGWGSCD
jgi:hypothetical protein